MKAASQSSPKPKSIYSVKVKGEKTDLNYVRKGIESLKQLADRQKKAAK